MGADLDNIDRFNTLVGLIFDELYRKFPLTTDIDIEKCAQSFDVIVTIQATYPRRIFGTFPESNVKFEAFFYATTRWLYQEGFTRLKDEAVSSNEVVLTAKALTALNAIPDALGHKSLGNKLGDLAKETGSKAASSAWGEIVGQVIGGITKSIASS